MRTTGIILNCKSGREVAAAWLGGTCAPTASGLLTPLELDRVGVRRLLQQQLFSAVVIDPDLPDGDAAELPALTAIPLLDYSARQPAWRERSGVYLAKPWATPRHLRTTIAQLLGIATPTCAGN